MKNRFESTCQFCGAKLLPTKLGIGYMPCECPESCHYDKLKKERVDNQKKSEKIEQLRMKMERMNKDCALLGRYSGLTFEKFKKNKYVIVDEGNKESIEIAESFCNEFPGYSRLLWLQGEPRIGKTCIANVAGNTLIQNGFTVFYQDAVSMVRDIVGYATVSKSEKSMCENRMKAISACDCLIIDDLGKGNFKDAFNGLFFDIVNSIYENKKRALIITSKEDPRKLTAQMGNMQVEMLGRFIEMMSNSSLCKLTGDPIINHKRQKISGKK